MENTASTPTATKSLFDHLYEGAGEILKGMQKPFVKNALRRKFEAAYDQTLLKVDEANARLTTLREGIKDFPLQQILEQRLIIKAAMDTQAAIEAEYKELFGKTILKRED
jgi:hypothetical protein